MEIDGSFDDDECLRILSSAATRRKGKYSDIFGNSETIFFENTTSFRKFSGAWINRIQSENSNPFENFIYLWFTFNSWLSLAVSEIYPGECDNDKFCIHAIAGSQVYADRFEDLYESKKKFRTMVDKFINWGPIFQASWMKKKYLPRWDKKKIKRNDFVQEIYKKHQSEINSELDKLYSKAEKGETPSTRQIPFSPLCGFKHDGKIPCDWHHTIHMIYQVRCNLFHGGKGYDLPSDRDFVDYSFQILWIIFKEESFVSKLLANKSS